MNQQRGNNAKRSRPDIVGESQRNDEWRVASGKWGEQLKFS